MSFKVQSLNPKFTKQLYTMLWRSYPEHYKNKPDDFFKPYIELDPYHDNESFRIILDNNIIAGTTKIFHRETYINGEKMKLGGIGLVAVNPDYRGKGLANIIMEDCVNFMKDNNFDISLLFAGPIPLYKKHGWISMQTKSYFFTDFKFSEMKPVSKSRFLRPICFNEDYSEIYYIHSETIKKINMGIIRNPNYWNNYVWRFTAKKAHIYGIEESGILLGYIIIDYNLKEKNIVVREYGILDDDVIPDMINLLYEKLKFSSVSLNSTGENTPLAKYLNSISEKIESSNEDGMMLRNISSSINITDKNFNDNSLFFGTDSF